MNNKTKNALFAATAAFVEHLKLYGYNLPVDASTISRDESVIYGDDDLSLTLTFKPEPEGQSALWHSSTYLTITAAIDREEPDAFVFIRFARQYSKHEGGSNGDDRTFVAVVDAANARGVVSYNVVPIDAFRVIRNSAFQRGIDAGRNDQMKGGVE